MTKASNLLASVAQDGGQYLTASAFVEMALRKAILAGRLPGGMPLRQEDLAVAFGVSRMPVREALRKLEAQALLDFVPHKGAVVTEISAADAADIYATRMVLEPATFERSIPALDAPAFTCAEELLTEMDSEQDQARMGELNRRFHMTLYSAAGSQRLIALTESCLASFDRYLRFHLAANGPAHLLQNEHRAMLEAAQARDTTKATEILRTHIETAAKTIQAFFANRS